MEPTTTARSNPVSLDAIRQLIRLSQKVIPTDYLDAMGHMNIRWYMALYDDAVWPFFASFGMDETYFYERRGGAFALKHFIQYLAEVYAGDRISIYGRLLGYSDKRIHFMSFMVDDTQERLASTIEVLGAHTDMDTRRLSPFPPDIVLKLGRLLDEHANLPWEAPTSGVIRP